MSRSITIFALIDALGWTYIEQHGFLQDALPYRKPIQTVLGFSSGAIPTILTGVQPEKHGHWNLFYYDPAGSPFWWMRYFRWLPRPALDNRYTRKIMQQLGRRVLGLGSLFESCVSPSLLPWFNWVEKKSIYACGGIAGAPSIFDQLKQQGVSFRVYTYHDSDDAQILQRAARDIQASNATFFFLYLSEMDLFLHYNCTQPRKVQEKLDWYAAELRGLLAAARVIDPNASLTVISDHGMTPVRQHHDLVTEIDGLGLCSPQDYLAVYDSTMARFWFFNDHARDLVLAALRGERCGHLLTEPELKQFGVYFEDGRFGQAIFLLDPGYIFSRSDFNGRGWRPAGMHGYHPGDRFSDAVFLSSQEPPVEVTTIADIYPCFQHRGVSQTTLEATTCSVR